MPSSTTRVRSLWTGSGPRYENWQTEVKRVHRQNPQIQQKAPTSPPFCTNHQKACFLQMSDCQGHNSPFFSSVLYKANCFKWSESQRLPSVRITGNTRDLPPKHTKRMKAASTCKRAKDCLKRLGKLHGGK